MTKITVREAAEAYRDYAKSLKLSESYIRIQHGYLVRFADCCDGNAEALGNQAPLGARQLNPRYITRFFNTLPDTAASYNQALTALNAFARFLEHMEYIGPGKANRLLGDRQTQKFTRLPKYYIPVSQFGPMIDAAGERHLVDRITLALAFYTLARHGEVAELRLKDLDLTEGTIRIYRPKRKRWTVVQICRELQDELDQWLPFYARKIGWVSFRDMALAKPDWHLVPRLECFRGRAPEGYYSSDQTEYFLNPELEPLRLEKLVKRMLDIFGAQTEDGKWVRHKGEGMHTIRRSGARAMIDYLATQWGEDKALLMVSTMLDHETTTMTLLYIGRSLEQKRLNAYLATGSMYGDHGRSPMDGDHGRAGLPSNVTRLPSRAVTVSQTGEVDAL